MGLRESVQRCQTWLQTGTVAPEICSFSFSYCFCFPARFSKDRAEDGCCMHTDKVQVQCRSCLSFRRMGPVGVKGNIFFHQRRIAAWWKLWDLNLCNRGNAGDSGNVDLWALHFVTQVAKSRGAGLPEDIGLGCSSWSFVGCMWKVCGMDREQE